MIADLVTCSLRTEGHNLVFKFLRTPLLRHPSTARRWRDVDVDSWQWAGPGSQRVDAPTPSIRPHRSLRGCAFLSSRVKAVNIPSTCRYLHATEAKFRGMFCRDYTEAAWENRRCLGWFSAGSWRGVICDMAEAELNYRPQPSSMAGSDFLVCSH